MDQPPPRGPVGCRHIGGQIGEAGDCDRPFRITPEGKINRSTVAAPVVRREDHVAVQRPLGEKGLKACRLEVAGEQNPASGMFDRENDTVGIVETAVVGLFDAARST